MIKQETIYQLWAVLQNENPVPITILAILEYSDSAILPKAIPVKALNTAKRNSGFGEISV